MDENDVYFKLCVCGVSNEDSHTLLSAVKVYFILRTLFYASKLYGCQHNVTVTYMYCTLLLGQFSRSLKWRNWRNRFATLTTQTFTRARGCH